MTAPTAGSTVRRKRPPFAVVPEAVLYSSLSDRAVRLYGVLDRYAGTKRQAWPGRQALATKVQGSREAPVALVSVDRALLELEDEGWLEVKERPGDTNDYIVHDRPLPPEARTSARREEKRERWRRSQERKAADAGGTTLTGEAPSPHAPAGDSRDSAATSTNATSRVDAGTSPEQDPHPCGSPNLTDAAGEGAAVVELGSRGSAAQVAASPRPKREPLNESPERETPPTPAQRGPRRSPRAEGTNPRALGTNPRANDPQPHEPVPVYPSIEETRARLAADAKAAADAVPMPDFVRRQFEELGTDFEETG